MSPISLKIVTLLYNHLYWFVKAVHTSKTLNLLCKNKSLAINGTIKIPLFSGYYVVIYMLIFRNGWKESLEDQSQYIKKTPCKLHLQLYCCLIAIWKYGYMPHINDNVAIHVATVCEQHTLCHWAPPTRSSPRSLLHDASPVEHLWHTAYGGWYSAIKRGAGPTCLCHLVFSTLKLCCVFRKPCLYWTHFMFDFFYKNVSLLKLVSFFKVFWDRKHEKVKGTIRGKWMLHINVFQVFLVTPVQNLLNLKFQWSISVSGPFCSCRGEGKVDWSRCGPQAT